GGSSIMRTAQSKWGTGHKALVVDDNLNIIEAIEMHLEPIGLTIVKAPSAIIATSILGVEKDISIIFIDAMLPGLNIDEIKQLKSDPSKSNRNPPLVVMCTNKQKKSFSNQGLHFLFKPLKKEQLLTITHSLITSHQPTNLYTTATANVTPHYAPSPMATNIISQTTKPVAGALYTPTIKLPQMLQSGIGSTRTTTQHNVAPLSRAMQQLSTNNSPQSNPISPAKQSMGDSTAAPTSAAGSSLAAYFNLNTATPTHTPRQTPRNSPLASPILLSAPVPPLALLPPQEDLLSNASNPSTSTHMDLLTNGRCRSDTAHPSVTWPQRIQHLRRCANRGDACVRFCTDEPQAGRDTRAHPPRDRL
ncbi:hypothetical protein SAMD00019534_124130, partial [Acytostelium subglobosum LB1]|uniref:hypothetical protein n=1 Tax=Acytostelium subglobosum LB1 TaxID=1410327 RepID=UPI000644CEAD